MSRLFILTLQMLMASSIQPTTLPSTQPATKPDGVARGDVAARVMSRSGADVWPTVRRLRFTFNVEKDGQQVFSASHDWDRVTHVDEVTWAGKTVSVDVSRSDHTGEQAEAFARWTNDSYWLLMPLKLRDAGVKLSDIAMTRDYPPSRARMTMTFENVGRTPSDAYDLSIDLREDRITHWVYRPDAQTRKGFSWNAYQNFNGLELSTEKVSDDKSTRIYFTDVSVDRE
jgi:hypothetical protein